MRAYYLGASVLFTLALLLISLGAPLERIESGLAEIEAAGEGPTLEEHVADSWGSLSIIPDGGQDPRIDPLSYELLTEAEHGSCLRIVGVGR